MISNFWNKYQAAVKQWLHDEFKVPAEKETNPKLKELKMAEYNKIQNAYTETLNEEINRRATERGERRISLCLPGSYYDKPLQR
ncbi:hypothetical protein EB796_007581 [Bugula neritina]|uniref:Uncharacterized protein n=1 Tax=Bugula neritina TaxID=10212 RepID=A0A7J7K660_BUGNE|nr:hypothetical protein EB796_007581 [Bugula neritina]